MLLNTYHNTYKFTNINIYMWRGKKSVIDIPERLKTDHDVVTVVDLVTVLNVEHTRICTLSYTFFKCIYISTVHTHVWRVIFIKSV
jgi:hypothetical protein